MALISATKEDVMDNGRLHKLEKTGKLRTYKNIRILKGGYQTMSVGDGDVTMIPLEVVSGFGFLKDKVRPYLYYKSV